MDGWILLCFHRKSILLKEWSNCLLKTTFYNALLCLPLFGDHCCDSQVQSDSLRGADPSGLLSRARASFIHSPIAAHTTTPSPSMLSPSQ